MKTETIYQVKRKPGRPRKASGVLSSADFRDRIRLTAQQYADEAGRKHAAVAAALVHSTVADMDLIIKSLREMIPFSDQKGLKDISETYRTCVTEVRRALGLSDSVESSGPKTLVSIQCVGEVSVSSPDGQTGMRPLPQMPDLSHLLPPKT